MAWLLRFNWNVPFNVYLFDSLERSIRSEPSENLYWSFRRQLVKNHAFCFHSGPPTFAVDVVLAIDRVAARRAARGRSSRCRRACWRVRRLSGTLSLIVASFS